LPNADRDPHEGMLLDHFGFGQMASTARVPLPVAGSSIVRTSSGRRRRSSGNFNASDQQLSAEMRRKLSNRASAARSNARRKARFDALKQSLEDVKQRVLELKQKHEAVSQENTELKQAVGGAEPDQGLASASFEDWSSLSHGLDAGLFGQLSDL
jgi:Basic region leucine zipper